MAGRARFLTPQQRERLMQQVGDFVPEKVAVSCNDRSNPKNSKNNRNTNETNKAVRVKKAAGCWVCGQDNNHGELLICEGCNGSCLPDHHRVGDGLDAMVQALPPTVTSRFGEIVWANGGSSYGWWPACIYDPRWTVGGARTQARKYLGKRHLVYFFCCTEVPFAVMSNNKLTEWYKGIGEDYCLFKGATTAAKNARQNQFQQALAAALLEEAKPIKMRLNWNHQGEPISYPNQAASASVAINVSDEEFGSNYVNDKSDADSGKDTKSKQKRALTVSFDEDKSAKRKAKPDKANAPSSFAGELMSTDEAPDSVIDPSTHKRSRRLAKQYQSNSSVRFDEPSAQTTASTSGTLRVTIPPFSNRSLTTGAGPKPLPGINRSQNTPPRNKENPALSNLFCKVYQSHKSAPATLVGFLTLPMNINTNEQPMAQQSLNFSHVRAAIVSELTPGGEIPAGWEWRFLIPTLGPLALAQEEKFSVIFAKNINQEGNGSLECPFEVTIVDAPQLLTDNKE